MAKRLDSKGVLDTGRKDGRDTAAVLDTGEQVIVASIKSRLHAKRIDILFMLIVALVTGLVSTVILVAIVQPEIQTFNTTIDDTNTFGTTADIDFSQLSDINSSANRSTILLVMLIFVLMASAVALYEIALVAVKGQTLGRMIAKIKIVRTENGEAPGWKRSALRFVLPVILLIVPLAGLILVTLPYAASLRDSSRRGWHDKVANTLSISTLPAPTARQPKRTTQKTHQPTRSTKKKYQQ